MKNNAYFFNIFFLLDLLMPVDRLTAEAKLSGDILHSSLNSDQQSLKVINMLMKSAFPVLFLFNSVAKYFIFLVLNKLKVVHP